MRQKLCFLLIFIASIVQAQYNQQLLFGSQNGTVLLDSLIDAYKTSTVLSYNNARDTMFAKIYVLNDSVRCVYTGHQLYLNPALDPSTALYQWGGSNGINTEHSYPQSKGADSGNAKSDLHHLFPVRAGVNSARSNHPYGESDDNTTTSWYYDTLSVPNPSPLVNIDAYSEFNASTNIFEPKEEHKGNAARAIFYFYTMYKAEADAADPTFFAVQLPSICQWHLNDPVDSLEWERSHIIASYQDGKTNPFVLDHTLVPRTYCPHLLSTGTSTLADFGAELYQNFPNPAQSSTTLQYELDRPTKVLITIYNATGQCLKVLNQGTQEAGFFQERINCSDWENGVYAYRLSLEQNGRVINVVKQFVVAN